MTLAANIAKERLIHIGSSGSTPPRDILRAEAYLNYILLCIVECVLLPSSVAITFISKKIIDEVIMNIY